MRIPLDIPPGLNGDDTTFAAAGRWSDGNNVRFWRGRPQVIGGWEKLITTALTGVCRDIFAWTDNSAVLNIGFGTHSNLQLWQGGGLYDITPALALPSATLGTDPIATVNTSPTITVTQNGHPYVIGDVIAISGATATATVTINGTWTVIAPVTTNAWTFTAGSNANATTTGGGTAVVVTPQRAYAAGSIDGTGGSGYGTGAYSTGTYSSPSTADFFPRTWSMSAWGQQLIASPRGGTLYTWTNATGSPAVALANAPAKVAYSLVAPMDGGYQLFAIGCNQEVSGAFNPLCIRHSSIRNNTEWNTATSTTAREYILVGGGRLVAGTMIGEHMLVWSSIGVYLGTFVGSLDQPWKFDPIDTDCGLIGPNAFAVVGQRAFWLGPDLQIYGYSLGGAVVTVDCPIRTDFVNNLAASQGDKISASTGSPFNEIRFDYPDARDGTENSRYIAAHVPTLLVNPEQAWTKGVMARTAFVDSPPVNSGTPLGVDPSGNIYWHERGYTADGGTFSWYIETADNYLDPESLMQVRRIYPDVKNQQGPMMVQVTSRESPQGTERTVQGTTMAPGAVKSDIRNTGLLMRVRFYATAGPTAGRIGKPIFDVTPAGKR